MLVCLLLAFSSIVNKMDTNVNQVIHLDKHFFKKTPINNKPGNMKVV